jgi:cysteine desulfurase/selenocysteine lyase
MRNDFPLLQQTSRNRPLVYLDNAATTQKPQSVLDSMDDFYRRSNANVHRAAHEIAARATVQLEQARSSIKQFLNADRDEEVIITKGTTEAINLLSNSLGASLTKDDKVLITMLEHHSNIVPWQMACQRSGAELLAVDIDEHGNLDWTDLQNKLTQDVKIFAFNHVSNALGTVNPVERMIKAAQDVGAVTVVDGAQAALHQPLDLKRLGCDFYVFSGHKLYGPTGIGVLYGKYDLLCEMEPWQGGGEMIESVSISGSTYQKPPHKFEAGTPAIAEIIGLGAAVAYVNSLNRETLNLEEQSLIESTLDALSGIPRIELIGKPTERLSVISFNIKGAHPHDVGQLLDQQGVAVRSGHHCTMPLMSRLNIPGTVRASFSFYSNQEDSRRLIEAVEKATDLL